MTHTETQLLDKLLREDGNAELKPQTDTKIEMMQTPAGYVKVGDVIAYDRSNKRIRFGTVTRLTKDGFIYLIHSYSIVYGDDDKQAIYQSMDGSIEQYRVCRVL